MPALETRLWTDCTGDMLLELERLADTTPDTRLKSSTRETQEKGMERQGNGADGCGDGEGRGAAQRQGGVAGGDYRCHANKSREIFLPKIDGSAITLAHLLQHLATSTIRAMLLGPESGGVRVRWCKALGTFGVPLRV
ncbi:hypothetical protein B0H13DRAFT_2556725 [Mycena leptocephala]|nr:hypothetical protein B0H13DRAFT_2556725 [Mycena leptocephala]